MRPLNIHCGWLCFGDYKISSVRTNPVVLACVARRSHYNMGSQPKKHKGRLVPPKDHGICKYWMSIMTSRGQKFMPWLLCEWFTCCLLGVVNLVRWNLLSYLSLHLWWTRSAVSVDWWHKRQLVIEVLCLSNMCHLLFFLLLNGISATERKIQDNAFQSIYI